MENSCQITIIVPVYNSERYLEESLQTILSQTYPDFHVLLIDDGSTDHSGDICDRFSDTDGRIDAYHISNQGPARARNFGLSHAQGVFVAFVDADDRLSPDFLERMLAVYREEDIDLIMCGYDRFFHDDPEEKKLYLLGSQQQTTLYTNRELAFLFTKASTSLSGVSVWGKLYKNSLIRKHGIAFPENVHYEEDCCFNLQYYRYVRKTVMIQDNLYHYRQQEASLSKVVKPNTYPDLLNGYRERKHFFEELRMEPEAMKGLDDIFLIVILNHYKKIIKSPMTFLQRQKEYRKVFAYPETAYVIARGRCPQGKFTKFLMFASRRKWFCIIDCLLCIWRLKNEGWNHHIPFCS